MRRVLLVLALALACSGAVAVADVREPSDGPVADCSRQRTSGLGPHVACQPWLQPYSR